MKTALLLLTLCAVSADLYAQSTVTGMVRDATGKGVPFADSQPEIDQTSY